MGGAWDLNTKGDAVPPAPFAKTELSRLSSLRLGPSVHLVGPSMQAIAQDRPLVLGAFLDPPSSPTRHDGTTFPNMLMLMADG
jgi:hypothetical protein